jgi:osmotically-inducible protein OsmY
VNKRDANASTKTPLDQKENQADVSLTAKIRQQVLDVKDLSIDARNVKIITADGKVTLRGPVKSSEERETIERIARDVAGVGNVENQLEVADTATTNPRR